MNISDPKFKSIVQESNSLFDVIERLGFNKTNTTQRYKVKRRIDRLGIDTSHFKRKRPRSRWSDAVELEAVAKVSKNITDFLLRMGLKNVGSNYKTAIRHLTRHKINIDHFDSNVKQIRNKAVSGAQAPLTDILAGLYPNYRTRDLKIRLIKEGVKQEKCEKCGQSDNWYGQKLVLHLDHIDGDNNNHRLSNLQILCPNCHSQTPTYAGRNRHKG